ncbi:MAG: DUF4230 domain-containing protein [Lachnospiraceae bacterium]|nr:DUF4230 domain-containing protein [Lachnospiraceae bacterium]
MRTRRITFAAMCVLMLLVSGCGKDTKAPDNNTTTQATTESVNTELRADEIRNICELVTLKCTYHNVAKSVKEAGTGLAHLGERDRVFWIEYVGEAEISFQTNDIQVEQNGTDVTITLPKPEVNCHVKVENWNEDSLVMSEDNVIQKNEITAEDETKAIGSAEQQMKESIESNSSLMSTARNQAKDIIENYIKQMGEITGVTYIIIWKDETSDN